MNIGMMNDFSVRNHLLIVRLNIVMGIIFIIMRRMEHGFKQIRIIVKKVVR